MIFLIYFIVISAITAAVTYYDKEAARNFKWRISEATLFLLALLGGALAEYITMKKIYHKTKHPQFMIGLPIIIAVQIILVVAFLLFN